MNCGGQGAARPIRARISADHAAFGTHHAVVEGRYCHVIGVVIDAERHLVTFRHNRA